MSKEDALAEAERFNAEPNPRGKACVTKRGFGENNYFIRFSSARRMNG